MVGDTSIQTSNIDHHIYIFLERFVGEKLVEEAQIQKFLQGKDPINHSN